MRGSRDRFPTSSEKNCCTVQLLLSEIFLLSDSTVQPVQDRSRRFDSRRAQKKRIFLYFRKIAVGRRFDSRGAQKKESFCTSAGYVPSLRLCALAFHNIF
jgi:hypothetical protein